MNVNNVGKSLAAQEYGKVNRKPATKEGEGTQRAGDKVELSSEGVLTSKVKGAESPSRAELIAKIQQEVDDGTYVTEEKLHQALDGAIDDAISGL